MKELSYKEFCGKIYGGESRMKPGTSGGYVQIVEDGEEIFYTEWTYCGIETDESGEVTPAGQNEIEKQDKEAAVEAYANYLDVILDRENGIDASTIVPAFPWWYSQEWVDFEGIVCFEAAKTNDGRYVLIKTLSGGAQETESISKELFNDVVKAVSHE